MTVTPRFAGTLLALIASAASAAAASAQQSPVPATAVICAQTALGALNPLVTPDLIAGDLRLALFTPPVLYDDRGGVRPHAATSWTWNADHTRLTMQLRNDLKWHDGRPLTAEDLVWTVRAAANKAYAFRNASEFAQLKSASTQGEHTAVLEFNSAPPAGMEAFVGMPILPRHLLENVPAAEFARAEYHRSPVGSGPYRFVGRTADATLTFERFAGFPAALGRPGIERIVMRAIPEPTAIAVALQTGNVDFCIASSTIVDHVKNSRTVRFLGLPPAGFQILPLNTKQGVLADARVRRALSAALNRTELTNVVSPVARVVRGPMPLNSPFLNARIGQPDNDPALADRLLNSAGWTRRDGPIRVNAAGQLLRVSVVAPQQAAPVMTAIQAQWRRAGVDLDLRMMEFAAFMGVVQNPATRPEATILGWFIDRVLTPDLFNQLHSKSPMNLSAFANPRADSALEQLRIVTREADRRALYDLVQTIVAEEVPNIYVMHTPRIGVLGPRLQGVQFDQNGAFATLTQWRVTGRPR